MQTDPRRFRAAFTFSIALIAGFLSAASAYTAVHQPNFLFVYTDDQRYDAMGVVQREQGEKGRYPWFKTPAMDRLAVEGTRFRNAFVTLSLCAPSRAAFLTGRYNHLNGIANNHTPFPTNSITWATQLGAAGYQTAYIGKWHMGQQRGQRPGFSYSASFIGQGKYWDCPIEINGESKPTKGWIDDVSTDLATEFIKEHRKEPFAIVVGFKACHGPWEPPERARDRFTGELARAVPSLTNLAIYRTAAGRSQGVQVDASGKVAVNLNYFRCVSAADDNLGRLLTTLDQLGLAEDTVVVFTSDNGYYQGEHGLGDKRTAYDESLRIPLLLRYPRLVAKGKALDQMVLNIDLAPTFLELAGVATPAPMQGQSWLPLLTGKPVQWRQAFLAEYFLEAQFPAVPPVVAVRTMDAKLIKYPGHESWTELFDLARDPYETRNLASDPEAGGLLARMQSEFDRQVKLAAFTTPDYADKPGDIPPTKKKSGKKKQKQPSAD